MTTLYKKKEQGSNWTYIGMEEATLSDLKSALEAHGMVAVPTEPTDEMIDAACSIGNVIDNEGNSRPLWKLNVHTQRIHEYKKMIKAAQDEDNGKATD